MYKRQQQGVLLPVPSPTDVCICVKTIGAELSVLKGYYASAPDGVALMACVATTAFPHLEMIAAPVNKVFILPCWMNRSGERKK